jgi:hypothetical protein
MKGTPTPIPTIVIDDTPIKRRGVCEFVDETPQLHLYAQAGDAPTTIQIIEKITEDYPQNPTLAGLIRLTENRAGKPL